MTEDPRFAQAVQNYEAGLKSLQSHKYDKAKAYFEKVVGGLAPSLPTAQPPTSVPATSTSTATRRHSRIPKSVMTSLCR